MVEIQGDFFKQAPNYDAVCVTTNGVIKNNGEAVMGAGIALAFKNKFPELPKQLAILLKQYGNRAFRIKCDNTQIITFPTKHHFKDDSDINLIKQSATQLVEIANKFNFKTVLLPRPGCANGHLKWENVKPKLEEILDDKFYVITR